MSTLSAPAPKDRQPGRVLVGVAWGVSGTFLLSLVPAIVRHLSSDMDPVEIIFHRSWIGAVVLGGWFLWRDVGRLRTSVFRLHLGRSVFNVIGMTMWFHGLAAMPLAQAVAVQFTLPLYTLVFAAIFLGERVGWQRWAATAVGFFGVLVILRPGFAAVGLPAMLVLGSAAFYATAVILIKLATRTDAALVIAFYSNLLMGVLSGIPTIFLWHGPSLAEVPFLLGLAALGTVAPYCLTRALALLEASLVAPMDFLRLPFIALTAWLFFSEVPDGWTWVGAAVIFASTTYIARRETRRRTLPP